MEHGTLHELLYNVRSLYQWEFLLIFPDLRCPEGFVNLCCNQVPNNSNFPAGCYYCFDEKLYGEGLSSEKQLVNDVYHSARKSGFSLIIGSSDTNLKNLSITASDAVKFKLKKSFDVKNKI